MYHEIQVVRLHYRGEYTVEITERRDDGSCLWHEHREKFFGDAHTANEYARTRKRELPDSLIFPYV
jgi:hypothetical protein